MKSYNEIIEFANLDTAVCDIVTKKNGIYMPFFDHFYPFIKENFNKNYEKLLEIATKKNIEFKGEVVNYRTGYYSMNINVDYNKVIEKLKESNNISNIIKLS